MKLRKNPIRAHVAAAFGHESFASAAYIAGTPSSSVIHPSFLSCRLEELKQSKAELEAQLVEAQGSDPSLTSTCTDCCT